MKGFFTIRNSVCLILVISIIFFQSCTITFPVIASKMDKSPDYVEVFDIRKLHKFEYVKIITNDSLEFYGEVINKKVFDQNFDIQYDSIINIYNDNLLPDVGDTMIVNTRSTTHIGLYSHIDYNYIWIVNEFGTKEPIKRNVIHSMTKNGEPFSKFYIDKGIRANIPYELTINKNYHKMKFHSDDILIIERLKFKPFIPMAVIGGLSADLFLFMYWILYVCGTAGLA